MKAHNALKNNKNNQTLNNHNHNRRVSIYLP